MGKKKSTKGKKGGAAMQQQGGFNPIVGATVGAAVGGVMGAAAAVALSDKETREKLKTVAANLRGEVAEKMEEMKGKAQDVAEVAKKEAQKSLMGHEEQEKKKAV